MNDTPDADTSRSESAPVEPDTVTIQLLLNGVPIGTKFLTRDQADLARDLALKLGVILTESHELDAPPRIADGLTEKQADALEAFAPVTVPSKSSLCDCGAGQSRNHVDCAAFNGPEYDPDGGAFVPLKLQRKILEGCEGECCVPDPIVRLDQDQPS